MRFLALILFVFLVIENREAGSTTDRPTDTICSHECVEPLYIQGFEACCIYDLEYGGRCCRDTADDGCVCVG